MCHLVGNRDRKAGKKSSIITEAALIPCFAISHNRNPEHKISALCIMCLPLKMSFKWILHAQSQGSHHCNVSAFSPFSFSQLLVKAKTRLFNSSRNFRKNHNSRQRQKIADKDHNCRQRPQDLAETEKRQRLMGNKEHHLWVRVINHEQGWMDEQWNYWYLKDLHQN